MDHFSKSLVEIGSVVSEEKIFFKFHPPFFLICIIGQNRQNFRVHKNLSILTDYANLKTKGDEIKKKSSPLKLLSQSQPNFTEMILGWTPSKLCLAFQTSDQDGRHSRT
jgi:hypothetical protein